MSPIEQYRALARYNRWINRKLFAAALGLSDEERKLDRGAFFGSIHLTLNHLLLTDRIWMLRFTNDVERYTSRTAALAPIVVTWTTQELYEDFEQLHRERERTDEDILEWTYALDEATLDRTLAYKTSRGIPQSHPTWWAAGHLFNHQTHHRGQVTTLLTQAGADVGVTDLIEMCREETIPTR